MRGDSWWARFTRRLEIVAILALGAACAGGSGPSQPGLAVAGAPDVAFGGPQGNTPQFVAECPYSHSSPADPIVAPGVADSGHMHDFFAAMGTDETSTAASLLAGETTCDQQLDLSAYWAPALFDRGERLIPDRLTAYYRPGPGIAPESLKPYPLGLTVIAGGGHGLARPPTTVTSWTCGVAPRNEPSPPRCPPGSGLRAIVTFPDCWDGVNLDSADHRSHLRYSTGGACPVGHPVAVPQLTVTIAYPVSGSGHELTLASGSTDTLHADFFNAWDEAKLATEVAACLHRAVVCGVTG